MNVKETSLANLFLALDYLSRRSRTKEELTDKKWEELMDEIETEIKHRIL